ncbi:PP2C family protein-serine/threonine phosphatase [Microbacterium sp. P5_E9]
MTLALRAAAVSERGEYRAVNQDAAFTASWGAGVADGVGGGPAGDLASAAYVHRLAAGLSGSLDPDMLATRLRIANWDLRAHVERDRTLEGMATTFTGLFSSTAGGLILAHAGDSRAYLLQGGVLTRQTRDDSFVQLLVDSGIVRAADAASHPHRNLITASLRGGDDDAVTILEREGREGDRWLLCSDGLTDYVPEPEIAVVLGGGDVGEAARALVDLALQAGSRDNVSAVVCDVVVATRARLSAAETAFAGSAAERFAEGLESA